MEVGHLNLLTEGKPDNREVTMNEKDLELHKRAERTCLMRAQAAKELTIQCMSVARHYGVDHQLKYLLGIVVWVEVSRMRKMQRQLKRIGEE